MKWGGQWTRTSPVGLVNTTIFFGNNLFKSSSDVKLDKHSFRPAELRYSNNVKGQKLKYMEPTKEDFHTNPAVAQLWLIKGRRTETYIVWRVSVC